jgi:hypothetical protein
VDLTEFCRRNDIPVDKDGLPREWPPVEKILRSINGSWDPNNLQVVRVPKAKGLNYTLRDSQLTAPISGKTSKYQDCGDFDDMGPLK